MTRSNPKKIIQQKKSIKMSGKKIVILGAMINSGREILKVLPEQKIEIAEIIAVDTVENEGQELSYGEYETVGVKSSKNADLAGSDIIFVLDKEIYNNLKGEIEKSDAVVIDGVSLFNKDEKVPLVIPGINSEKLDLYDEKNVVSVPSCSTTELAIPLAHLHEKYGVKRVVVSTYQAVSERGMDAMDELYSHTKAIYQNSPEEPKKFVKQIPFNVIPMVADKDEDREGKDGSYDEELNIVSNIKKLLGDEIKVSATCVTVPVFVGSSMSVNVELKKEFDFEEVTETLGSVDGIVVIDRPNENTFTTPKDCICENDVYISRIRKDNSLDNGLNMWIVADNVRVGVTNNAAKVAKLLVEEHGI